MMMTMMMSSTIRNLWFAVVVVSTCFISSSSTVTALLDLDNSIVLDLTNMVENPPPSEINSTILCEAEVWCQFRPNLNKLILSGAADIEHVAILYYPIDDGSVGLHYHGKTESVYTVYGSQTDEKGSYPTGSVYFNPPGSGHSVWNSTGFFILAYAAPPAFDEDSLALIDYDYTPIVIDTTTSMTPAISISRASTDVTMSGQYKIPLDGTGGMTSSIYDMAEMITAGMTSMMYTGNYVLVLDGMCHVNGQTFGPQMLIVGKDVIPEPYEIAIADEADDCKFLGLAFEDEEMETSPPPTEKEEDETVPDSSSPRGTTTRMGTIILYGSLVAFPFIF